ncbi:HIT domain-containing protein [Candidatus Saccharibacteria bacterium]|nr:HIT domain-containing protein [Candidatus Saccharibacteria bacterium]
MKHQRTVETEKECLFCDIAAGKKDEKVEFEDEEFIVVRDIKPSSAIHLLIIPKDHIGPMGGDLAKRENIMGKLFTLTRQLAKKLEIEDSYKLVMNAGHTATVSPDHIHVHFIGGWKSPTEVQHV